MQIRRLRIENFRSIEQLTWCPSPGINCLIGPGDTGKTSILDAVTLLLTPYNAESANELDYRERNIERGFRIEAVFGGLDDDLLVQQRQVPPLRGWQDGEVMPLPDEGGAEPALVCEVVGDYNLDLGYSILPLDGDPISFSPSIRRALALARISASERANRDLRFGKGSLLARYFRGSGFGGSLTEAVRGASDDIEISDDVVGKLTQLKQNFSLAGLPDELQFGLLPAFGWSLTGMVALAVGQSSSTAIPIAAAGTGTRNLSLLEISAMLAPEHPTVVVDEPERGLEPYRQRGIAGRLRGMVGSGGQAFVTTHAPAILGAMAGEAIWHVAASGVVISVEATKLKGILEARPEAFFARVPIACEGPTEIGLLTVWLPPLVGGDLASLGIELVDGRGQPQVLTGLEGFADAGIPCAGFLDNEDKHSGRREELTRRIVCFEWIEKDVEDAVSRHLSEDLIDGLILFTAELRQIQAQNLYAQLRDELQKSHEASGLTVGTLVAECGLTELRRALGSVMSNKGWFKSIDKGRALATYLNQVGVPPAIERQISSFGESIRDGFNL